jgi:hypothetical protein
MRSRINQNALWLLLFALAGVQACIAKTSTPETYVTEKTRDIEGGRKVLIIMPLPTLGATVNWDPLQVIDHKTFAVFGSAAEMESYNEQVREAQRFMVPLQKALSGYELETKVRGAIEPIVTGSPWLRGQDVEVTNNLNSDYQLMKLNESNTRQMLVVFVDHRCDVTCSAIAISLKATMLVRQIPRGYVSSMRLSASYIPYQVTFNAVVHLKDPDPKNAEVNRDRWAANDAALARRAIDIGADWAIDRFARNLDETRDQNEEWSSRGDRKGRLGNGRPGWVISRSDTELTYFDARSHALNFETTIGP